jgi:hypothetical protein
MSNITVTGKVLRGLGFSVPNAKITIGGVKGVSDANGNFSIVCPSGADVRPWSIYAFVNGYFFGASGTMVIGSVSPLNCGNVGVNNQNADFSNPTFVAAIAAISTGVAGAGKMATQGAAGASSPTNNANYLKITNNDTGKIFYVNGVASASGQAQNYVLPVVVSPGQTDSCLFQYMSGVGAELGAASYILSNGSITDLGLITF